MEDPLELRITGRHAKIRPSIRTYAEEKLGPVVRYDRRTRLVEVILDHEPLSTTVEAKAHVGSGAPLVVKAKHETPEGAIDLIHDKIERAVRKHKERVRDRNLERRRAAASPPAGAAAGAAGAAGALAGGEEE